MVWAVPRSLATTYGIICYFLLLRLLRCFSSAGLLLIFRWIIRLQRIGLSHSEILGSRRICQSPKLIAAYHVLLRLQEPRHPPCALIYFLLLCFYASLLSFLNIQHHCYISSCLSQYVKELVLNLKCRFHN